MGWGGGKSLQTEGRKRMQVLRCGRTQHVTQFLFNTSIILLHIHYLPRTCFSHNFFLLLIYLGH